MPNKKPFAGLFLFAHPKKSAIIKTGLRRWQIRNMTNNKKILLIVIVITASVIGCYLAYFPRANRAKILSQKELEAFVGNNYALEKTLQADFDHDNVDEYILIVGQKEGGNLKIVYLDWHLLRGWKKKDEVGMESNRLGPAEVIDLDKDKKYEIFIKSYYSSGGSGTGNYYNFYKIENSEIKSLNEDISSNISDHYFSDDTLYIPSFIWSSGETHFGSHYVKVDKYVYNGEKFVFSGSDTTKAKYDFGDTLDESDDWIGVSRALRERIIFPK